MLHLKMRSEVSVIFYVKMFTLIVQGSYTFLPTNFHDFSMTFVTISMT